MRRIFAIFIVLSVISLVALRVRSRNSASPEVLSSGSPAASDTISVSAAAPTPPVSALDPTPEDREKLRVFNEILAARNGRDSRLETEFRGLTPATKALLEKRYAELPAERRAARGTVIFVIGRNLSTSADFAFLKGVMTELPCLSLKDCEKSGKTTPSTELALDYPQLMALRSIDAWLRNHGSPATTHEVYKSLRDDAVAAVRAAVDSKIPLVAEQASELYQRLTRTGRAS